MNYLIILSGGTGTRMGSEIPKQYLKVNEKPILQYTLECFDFDLFDKVVIVVSDAWKDYVQDMVQKNFNAVKFIYAGAGSSRQGSIINGMKSIPCSSAEDIILIHDGARPNLKSTMVDELISSCEEYDGAMPVIPVKDTIYVSKEGKQIDGLLNRDTLFAGQSPESFNLQKYLSINQSLTPEEIEKIRGSSEIAYKNNMRIKMIKGDEGNFKITTPSDLEAFTEIVRREHR